MTLQSFSVLLRPLMSLRRTDNTITPNTALPLIQVYKFIQLPLSTFIQVIQLIRLHLTDNSYMLNLGFSHSWESDTACFGRNSLTVWRTLLPPPLGSKSKMKKKKSYPCNRPWRPIGLWDIVAPTFSLDNRLTDGTDVVSLTRWSPFTPQENSWYWFLLEAESTPGP
jgi:hypothetical protein